jgi:hypothetical protein
MTRKMTEYERWLTQGVIDVLSGKTGLFSGDILPHNGRVNDDDGEGVSVFLEPGESMGLSDAGTVAKVCFDGMYDWDMPRNDGEYGKPVFSFRVMEALAIVFGSKHINVGEVEGGGGCESCGYGGHYKQELFIHNATPVDMKLLKFEEQIS